jgi:hypothetical protein
MILRRGLGRWRLITRTGSKGKEDEAFGRLEDKKTIKNLGSEMKDPNWLFPYPRNESHLNRAVRQLNYAGSTAIRIYGERHLFS